MKRSEVKRTPLTDTVIESLAPEAGMYRERHADGVYLRFRPNERKDWQPHNKKSVGSWSWLGRGFV